MLGSSRVAAQLVASQEGLSSMSELIVSSCNYSDNAMQFVKTILDNFQISLDRQKHRSTCARIVKPRIQDGTNP
jgi:hypothetical protein